MFQFPWNCYLCHGVSVFLRIAARCAKLALWGSPFQLWSICILFRTVISILSYLISSYLILSHLISSYLILSYLILSYLSTYLSIYQSYFIYTYIIPIRLHIYISTVYIYICLYVYNVYIYLSPCGPCFYMSLCVYAHRYR